MKRIHIFAIAAVMMMLAIAPSALAGSGDTYTITKDVVYGHKMGMALTYDIIQPKEGSNGAGIMFMNSGGWFSSWFEPEQALTSAAGRSLNFKSIVDSGFTLYIVRHGSAPLFKVPDAVADVKLATRHIKYNAHNIGVDPDRLGVFGGSAGGHLSLMLGNDSDEGKSGGKDPVRQQDNRVAAVVAYFPPVDLREFVGTNDRFPALDFKTDLAGGISPILQVSKDDPPTLLIHGDKDDLVPVDHSKRIFAAFQKAGVTSELIVIEGAGHGFRGDDADEAGAALIAWFEKYLAE